ncbi:hypothetical protein HMPREF9241_00115 [Schaalia turicensis ACS-279-V-Col4]|uniref:WCX domain-containing protein n=1 Tax=Schaalia turicensis ACS-279-V-Col4 TaxID=883077 RepID=K0Z7R0_9ACTO|nr:MULTISPECIES: WYL domain-containing protein [Actinomycetaceae]EJZ88254.1 hypothetical protein HMPREF9241_00115 [Schaalia turicensis ACS-279-V-Col4]MDK7123095.1 WYL domain-containing protein [Pauljensenia sp. UMB6358]
MGNSKSEKSQAHTQRGYALAILKYLLENTSPNQGATALRLTQDFASGNLEWNPPEISERTAREYLHYLKSLGNRLPFGIRVQQFADIEGESPVPPEERRTNWFATAIISPAQMRVLADALQMSRFYPDDVSDLRSLLASLASVKPEHLESGQILFPDRPMFKGVPATLLELDSAISGGHKIRFSYSHVALRSEAKGRQAPGKYCSPNQRSRRGKTQRSESSRLRDQAVLKESGKKYEFYPYTTVFKRGDYYLLAGKDPHPNENTRIFHFVIDRISDIKILEGAADSVDSSAFDFVRYVNERPYFFSGQAVDVIYRVTGGLDGTFSWFPDAQVVPDGGSDCYRVHVRAQPNAMVWWALQYAGSVEVLSPPELREEITKTLEETLRKYREKNE